jgi:hypothetical protein
LGGSVSELFEWSVVQTSPKIYAQFHRYEPLKMIVEDVSRLAQGVGLCEVTAVAVTDLLDCHEQHLSNDVLHQDSFQGGNWPSHRTQHPEKAPLPDGVG